MAGEVKKKVGNLRWWVVGLIALAAVINYIDRQALGVLWTDMGVELFPDVSPDDRKIIYGFISSIFVLSYAFGQAIFGKIFDWIGTRLGFALSISVWSIATALHAFASGVASFGFFRALLGVAEAGNWPGATKGNAEWFPTKERAFAQGLFNSGAAVGGIVSIPLIALLSVYFGWKSIFVIIGLAGLLWLIPWMYLVKSPPQSHPWISDEEREYILSGQQNEDLDKDGNKEDEYVPNFFQLLSHKQSWGIILASAAIDPIWWLFVFWIPIYLAEVYGMDVKGIGIYGWVPYVGAMLGALFGGRLAQNFISNGRSVNWTRKTIITLGCIIMLPTLLAMSIPGKPSVLSVFGVQNETAITMANTDVKALYSDPAFSDLVKDEDFIERLAGKNTLQIEADPEVSEALKNLGSDTPEPSKATLSTLGSLKEINHAKNVAATISVLLMAIILFGFQVAIGNVQTLPSDFYSGKTVGTLAGLAGMAAKLGAFGLTMLVPWLTTGGNYTPAFIVGATLAIIALASVWILCPKIEPLKAK